ncbi:hypothetical protein [Brachybacterium sp. FME24]|uniref:hypothetical protein n=1 Tax=Brachybacterium sp. FME24 TaxID=2742605 RepID=UPI001866775B|nr:hypothetical protein [Brachybacterium sp. FME24]
MRRPRRLVLSAAALGLALAASGCTYLSPVQTHDFYQAADGTNGTLEEAGTWTAGVRNMIVVIDPEGPAEVAGSVVNYTDQELTVDLEGTTEEGLVFSTRVAVPAHETVELGSGEGQQSVPIGDVTVNPGVIMELSVSAEGESAVISMPVTDESLEHLQDDGETPAPQA